jgi:sugar phosphate isomerase/epimerase
VVTRREFGKAALAGAALAVVPAWARPAAAMTARGVKIGIITGSLNPLPENPAADPIDVIIEQTKALGVVGVELVTVYPQGAPQVVNGGRFGQAPAEITPDYTRTRQALREWRINLPLDRFRDVRARFDKAGLNLFSYVQTIDDHMSDAEIEAVFKQLQALKVPMFTTNQTRVGMGPKIAPFAEKYGIKAAWHPHANVQDPNEVATPESMEKLLAMSKAFVINLDIGHYTAGNNDAVAFLRKHHERITHLHIKDRKRDNGPNVALGTGDTPIKQCATLIRDNKWPISLIIEREYRDAPGTPVEQTRGQLNYVRSLLET